MFVLIDAVQICIEQLNKRQLSKYFSPMKDYIQETQKHYVLCLSVCRLEQSGKVI